MSSSNRVPNFTASQSGLQFINSFPSEPDIIVNVPVYGNVAIGDASNGLCGGMVFTVRDLFEFHQRPLPGTMPPPQGSPLFNFIVSRLFDSFNLPGGVLKYFEWMNTPDHDTGVWVAIRRGVAWHTIVEEWPKIKADIDAGHPSPLGIVTVYSINPGDLGQNHQVLAYGYNLDNNNNLTLRVYDPNTMPSSADNVTLALNLGNPSHTTPITHNIGIGHSIRGFFRVDYTPKDPSFLEPPLPTMTARVTTPPLPLPEGPPVSFTVHAEDAEAHRTIAGNVSIDGVNAGQTDRAITHVFAPRVTRVRRRQRAPGTGSGRPTPGDLEWVTVITTAYPKGQVSAPGFAPVPLDFGFHDREQIVPDL
jgi:hypothetical protein